MFYFPYIGLDKAFGLDMQDLYPDASSLLPGKGQHPSDPISEQSEWSETEPEDDSEEADEDDEEIGRDNDSHLLLYIVWEYDSAEGGLHGKKVTKLRTFSVRGGAQPPSIAFWGVFPNITEAILVDEISTK